MTLISIKSTCLFRNLVLASITLILETEKNIIHFKLLLRNIDFKDFFIWLKLYKISQKGPEKITFFRDINLENILFKKRVNIFITVLIKNVSNKKYWKIFHKFLSNKINTTIIANNNWCDAYITVKKNKSFSFLLYQIGRRS